MRTLEGEKTITIEKGTKHGSRLKLPQLVINITRARKTYRYRGFQRR